MQRWLLNKAQKSVMSRTSTVQGAGCRMQLTLCVQVLGSSLRMGARRIPMTSKRGKQNFYKGRGAKSTGRHTRKGGYVVMQEKIPDLVVPSLEGFELKPYVSHKTPYTSGKVITAQDLLDIAGHPS